MAKGGQLLLVSHARGAPFCQLRNAGMCVMLLSKDSLMPREFSKNESRTRSSGAKSLDRRERLAEELRSNLSKRKALARLRKDGGRDRAPDGDEPGGR